MSPLARQLYFEGSEHIARRDHARAEQCLRQATAISPEFAEAHANLGWLLEEASQLDEAARSYRQAAALCPQSAHIQLNYATLLSRRKEFGPAEQVFQRAIELDPASAAVWSNLAVMYTQMELFDQAEDCCRKSLALAPGYANAKVNLSYLCLREGRFEEGLAAYEARAWQSHLLAGMGRVAWHGEPLNGRSILIGPEGGHGDIIQFARYASELKLRGAGRVGLVCPPALLALMTSLTDLDDVLPMDAAPDPTAWDCRVSLMSLPFLCQTRLASIPARLPYLQAPSGLSGRWHDRLPASGLRVGLVWRGNANFQNDDERSLPSLSLLASLAEVAGVCFISLQKGRGEEEAGDQTFGSGFQQFATQINSFADTAAIVQQLDLVISVDTAVAHLAGAMGKACWVLLPSHLTDWRWLTERSDSPWYPGTMRLFRQSVRGDWSTTIAQVHDALQTLSFAAAAPACPLPPCHG